MAQAAAKRVANEIYAAFNATARDDFAALLRMKFQLGTLLRTNPANCQELVARAGIHSRLNEIEEARADLAAAHGMRHGVENGQAVRLNIAIGAVMIGDFPMATQMVEEVLEKWRLAIDQDGNAVAATIWGCGTLTGNVVMIRRLVEAGYGYAKTCTLDFLANSAEEKLFTDHQAMVLRLVSPYVRDYDVELIKDDEDGSPITMVTFWLSGGADVLRDVRRKYHAGAVALLGESDAGWNPLSKFLAVNFTRLPAGDPDFHHDESDP